MTHACMFHFIYDCTLNTGFDALDLDSEWIRTKTHALIIVYDCSDDESLDDIRYMIAGNLFRYFPPEEVDDAGMPILLLGSKKDLINLNKEENWAERVLGIKEFFYNRGYCILPIQCSAKTGENVQNVFQLIADELTKTKAKYQPVVHRHRRRANKLCVCS